MLTEYVAGFLFRNQNTEVALVQKNRPAWQSGLFNGIGGHIEIGETPEEAMVREFREETGAELPAYSAWVRFCTLELPGARIFFFRAFGDADIKPLTDEWVGWKPVGEIILSGMTIPNLRWLLPAALDPDGVLLTAGQPNR